MAKDSTEFVQPAILAVLRAAAELAALVPVDRQYGGQRPANPPWPFTGYGRPISRPFTASCLEGSAVSVAIHAYAETSGEGDDTIAGDEMATSIIRVIVALLGGEDGAELDLTAVGCPYPATAHVSWTDSQVIQDGNEGDAWHGWATFDITVSS